MLSYETYVECERVVWDKNLLVRFSSDKDSGYNPLDLGDLRSNSIHRSA
jgi:hypothetical protein